MTFTASTYGTHSTGLTLRRTTHTKNDATRVENQYTTAQLTATLGPLPQFYLPAFSLQFGYRRWFVEEKKKHYEYISMDQLVCSQLVCLRPCSVFSLPDFQPCSVPASFFSTFGVCSSGFVLRCIICYGIRLALDTPSPFSNCCSGLVA
jgi:hypothetical protein